MSTITWQQQLASAITDPAELLQLLDLDPHLLEPAKQAGKEFTLRIPRCFVARMKKGDLHDPLLRQALPLGEELQVTPGFSFDPLAELTTNPAPGLLHKYHGRVLLTVTGACAIHCRYCFRRHFPYSDNNPGDAGWEKALSYIADDPTIHEVIFSGGDPLVATDKHLAKLIQRIATIPHVTTLRIHTRMPVVLPARITASLMEIFSKTRLHLVCVIHANHPQEIDRDVEEAITLLRAARFVLLNQAVLLKGVNDNADVQIALSEALFHCGVLPYYLHLLDKVQGVAHFDVDLPTAQHIVQAMEKHLPGYLVPRLVREVAGTLAKERV